jgi:hypothetical protein
VAWGEQATPGLGTEHRLPGSGRQGFRAGVQAAAAERIAPPDGAASLVLQGATLSQAAPQVSGAFGE